MKPELTPEQIALLKNKDVKAIAVEFAKECNAERFLKADKAFDSFASQFQEKKVRFTTNDNYVVYEGDTTKICYVTMEYLMGEDYADRLNGASLTAYFKSKEKAEQYITLNAPKLSVNDVMKWYDKHLIRDEFETTLINLVKSK